MATRKRRMSKKTRKKLREIRRLAKIKLKQRRLQKIREALARKGKHRYAITILKRNLETDSYEKLGVRFIFSSDSRRACEKASPKFHRSLYCVSAQRVDL